MKFTLSLLCCLMSTSAVAGFYKCTDAEGNVAYKSSPCAEGRSNISININSGGAVNLDDEKNQELQKLKQEQEDIERQKRERQKQQAKEAQFTQDVIRESTKNQQLIKNNPSQYSAYAIPPYPLEQLPEYVKGFRDRLPDIERFRGLAAMKALETGECERVEASELNVKSSNELLVFLVNCSSGKPFYFNEKDLAK